ncbi:hypothetical protein Trydic_g19260, partial [Trypoxylus dichotomus]
MVPPRGGAGHCRRERCKAPPTVTKPCGPSHPREDPGPVERLPADWGYQPLPTAVLFGPQRIRKSLGRGESTGPDSPGPSGTLEEGSAAQGGTAQTIGATTGAIPKSKPMIAPKPGEAGMRPPAQKKILSRAKKDSGPLQGATTVTTAGPSRFCCET